MALTKCGECGDVISDKAKTCPKCGAPAKKKTSLFTWIFMVFVFLFLIPYIFVNESIKPTKLPSPNVSQTSTSVHLTPYNPVQKWGAEKVASAKK